MRIVAISDIHSKEAWLNLPSGDTLIIAGDISIESENDIYYFKRWLHKQNFSEIIIVAGNHDIALERMNKHLIKDAFLPFHYLQEDFLELKGLRFYGVPYSPEFNNWSFMYPRCSLEAKNIWQKIPKNLDFLISHTMPYQILDTNYKNEHCGCEVLQREVFKKRPKHFIGGHLHQEGGTTKIIDGIKFYNVSVLDEEYKLTHKPTIINI